MRLSEKNLPWLVLLALASAFVAPTATAVPAPPKTIPVYVTQDIGIKTTKTFQACIPPQGAELPTQTCFSETLSPATPGDFTLYENYVAFYANAYWDIHITFNGAYQVKANTKLKYQILGVTYAPPGAQSQVSYVSSNTLATSTSTSKSFASTVKITVSDLSGGNNLSNSYTQEKDTATSISISNSATNGVVVRGPQSSALGIDHDYDVIWVWLNPVADYQIVSATSVLWNGYTYNAADTNEMEVVPLYVIWLKDPTQIPADVLARLQRTWDKSGIGALNDTDYANILDADPLALGTGYDPNTDTTGRFDLVGGQTVSYEPPPEGGLPITQSYSLATSTTSSIGKTAKYTYTVGSNYTTTFGDYVKFNVSNQFTLTDSYSTSNNVTTGKTASVTITGPGFNDNYTGPTVFQVWRDNIYGSFMFFPVN